MCMNLYRNIDREKIQFDFVKHTDEKGTFEDEITELGGKIYTAPKFRIFNLMKYKSWWKKHLIEHLEHQIIHGHMFTISSVYFKVAQKLKRITVGHSHSSKPSNNISNIKNIFKTIMRKDIAKIADYRLACSVKAGEFLFPNKDFHILKNAIDANTFIYNPKTRNEMRKKLGYTDLDIVLSIVASFTVPKNPLGVLEIFKEIHKNNLNIKLLWVGDGPLRAAFESEVSNAGLNDSVKTLGVRNDIPNILQAADIFMLASFFEGLPVSAVEAQASGLPCLLSEGISRETAITDLCRFLPIDKPELWAKAVSELDLSKRRNTKSEIVNAGYDIEKTAKWLENFYISIIEKRNSNNGQ